MCVSVRVQDRAGWVSWYGQADWGRGRVVMMKDFIERVSFEFKTKK